jgi:hypothetical protein
MTYDRIVRLCEWKPLPTRLAGRPTIRWENDIKDLRIMNLNNWTKYNQDQFKWKEVVEKAKTFTQ